MVDLLIKDCANPDRDDRRFPFLRHFDAYAGHSWANGPALFAEGNNEESSSEDANFATAVILWGALDRQARAARPGHLPARQPGHRHRAVLVRRRRRQLPRAASTARRWAWCGAPAASTTPGGTATRSTSTGSTSCRSPAARCTWAAGPDYVRRNHAALVEANKGEPRLWREIIWMYLALAEPRKALAQLRRQTPTSSPSSAAAAPSSTSGCTRWPATARWTPPSPPTRPTYAVLRAGGTRHHVAFNPAARRRAVRFSDGVTVELGPFEQKVVSAPDRPADGGPMRRLLRTGGGRSACVGRGLWRSGPSGRRLAAGLERRVRRPGRQPARSRPSWSFEIGGHGWGNQRAAVLHRPPDNAALDGAGDLVITARREVDGRPRLHLGRLITRGKSRARLRPLRGAAEAAGGQGAVAGVLDAGRRRRTQVGWPGCGEIDIVEARGAQPWRVSGAAHGPGYSGGNALIAGFELPAPGSDGRRLTDDFHLYAVEWEPDEIRFFVDEHLLPHGARHPAAAAGPVGLRPPVLPAAEPGGRRQLRRPAGRHHAVPCPADRRSRARVHPLSDCRSASEDETCYLTM